jgi:GTP-binding protein HflX
VMMVFNKVDAYSFLEKEEGDLSPATRENITLDELKRTWIAKMNNPAQFISATKKLHLEEFREQLYKSIHDIHIARYPYNKLLY